jgi:hypothetical protein
MTQCGRVTDSTFSSFRKPALSPRQKGSNIKSHCMPDSRCVVGTPDSNRCGIGMEEDAMIGNAKSIYYPSKAKRTRKPWFCSLQWRTLSAAIERVCPPKPRSRPPRLPCKSLLNDSLVDATIQRRQVALVEGHCLLSGRLAKFCSGHDYLHYLLF